jgi:hypothetical protein
LRYEEDESEDGQSEQGVGSEFLANVPVNQPHSRGPPF